MKKKQNIKPGENRGKEEKKYERKREKSFFKNDNQGVIKTNPHYHLKPHHPNNYPWDG